MNSTVSQLRALGYDVVPWLMQGKPLLLLTILDKQSPAYQASFCIPESFTLEQALAAIKAKENEFAVNKQTGKTYDKD